MLGKGILCAYAPVIGIKSDGLIGLTSIRTKTSLSFSGSIFLYSTCNTSFGLPNL